MATPLRVGFLLSALLHAMVVAAFSLSWRQDVPVADEPQPLTLSLAVFKPAQAAPVPPAPPVPVKEAQPDPEPEPQVVEEPPPPSPEQRQEITPPVEPLPVPVAKRAQAKPVAKPQKVVERVGTARPVKEKRIKSRPVKPRSIRAKPVKTAPVPTHPITLASAAKPQPATTAVDTKEKQHYLAALAAKIDRSKYYPLGSRRRGEEGKVVIHFVIQKNGELTEISVVESSGSKRLDAAALKTVRRVTPFRPIPEVLKRDHWPISVPIAFSLSG